jgi:hypothetical protein
MAMDIPVDQLLGSLIAGIVTAFFAIAQNTFLLMGVIIFILWLIIEESIKRKHKKKKQDLSKLLPYLLARGR